MSGGALVWLTDHLHVDATAQCGIHLGSIFSCLMHHTSNLKPVRNPQVIPSSVGSSFGCTGAMIQNQTVSYLEEKYGTIGLFKKCLVWFIGILSFKPSFI